MPFRQILDDLIASTDGALGALFLDESGEIVHAVEASSEHDLGLVGAWVGIYLRQLERMMASDDLGEVEVFQSQNDRFHLFARPLTDGYSVVLLQRTPSLSAQAQRALVRAGDRLVHEVLA